MEIEKLKRVIKLEDETEVTIRPLVKEDEEKFMEFFQRFDDRDVRYLADDIKDTDMVKKWIDELNYTNVLPLIALHDNKVVASVAMRFDLRIRRSHVATLSVLLDKKYREKGIVLGMCSACDKIATAVGVEKLKIETPTIDLYALERASLWGYSREATLIREFKVGNEYYDIAVLSKYVKMGSLHPPEVLEEFEMDKFVLPRVERIKERYRW
ncbi:MAG: N-acetyltransferase family protein [Archaeoglobaceae archaeon]